MLLYGFLSVYLFNKPEAKAEAEMKVEVEVRAETLAKMAVQADARIRT